MGPGALTAEGWRVFAPVEEDGGSRAFSQVSWPESQLPPDSPGMQTPPS
jgi:hypothetical protein